MRREAIKDITKAAGIVSNRTQSNRSSSPGAPGSTQTMRNPQGESKGERPKCFDATGEGCLPPSRAREKVNMLPQVEEKAQWGLDRTLTVGDIHPL